MKKQTAVEWLVDQLPTIQQEGLRDQIEQALAMEKEQIEEAFDDGKREGSDCTSSFEWGIRKKEQKPSEYYTETYGCENGD
jgi:hypothetical protein